MKVGELFATLGLDDKAFASGLKRDEALMNATGRAALTMNRQIEGVLKNLGNDMRVMAASEKLMGAGFVSDAEKASVLKGALRGLIDAGLTPADARVKALAADLQKLGSQATQTAQKRGIAGLAQSVRNFATADLSLMGAGLRALPWAGVAYGAKRAADSIAAVADQAEGLQNLSQTTGLATQQLQGLKFIADQGGFSFEGLANTATMLTRKLMGIEQDSGFASDAMKMLGIETKNSDGSLRSMSELFPEIIKRLQSMENVTQRNTIAGQLFGRNMADIAPLLGMTAEQTKELTDQAHRLGLVWSNETMKSALELDATLDSLKATQESVAQSLKVIVLPYVNDLGIGLVKLAADLGLAGDSWKSLMAQLSAGTVQATPRVKALGPFANEFAREIEMQRDVKQRLIQKYRDSQIDALMGGSQAMSEAQFKSALSRSDANIREVKAGFNKASKDFADAQSKASQPFAPGGGKPAGGGGASAAKAVLDPIAQAWKSFYQQERTNAGMEQLLGKEFDLNAAKASVFESAIQSLLNAGLKPTDAKLVALRDSLARVRAEMAAAGKTTGGPAMPTFGAAPEAPGTFGTLMNTMLTPWREGLNKMVSSAAEAKAKLQDEFKGLLSGLKESTALMGKDDGLDKFIYELQNTTQWAGLTEAQINKIITAYKNLDAATAAEASQQRAIAEAADINANAMELLGAATAESYKIAGKSSPAWEMLVQQLTELSLVVKDPKLRQALLQMGAALDKEGRQAGTWQKRWQSQIWSMAEMTEAAAQNMANSLRNNLSGAFLDIMNGAFSMKSFLQSIFDSIKQAIADILAQMVVGGLVNALTGGAGGFMGGFLGSFAEGSKGVPYPGGWGMVGERGPELMRLPGGTQILPNNMLSGMGGQTNHIAVHNYFTGPINSNVDLERNMDRMAGSIVQRLRLVTN